jgi:hypothetical protein
LANLDNNLTSKIWNRTRTRNKRKTHKDLAFSEDRSYSKVCKKNPNSWSQNWTVRYEPLKQGNQTSGYICNKKGSKKGAQRRSKKTQSHMHEQWTGTHGGGGLIRTGPTLL